MKRPLYLPLLVSLFITAAPVAAKEHLPLNNMVQDKQPLTFIENKGQVTDQHHQQRKDIDFKLNAGNMTMFAGDAQLHYQWNKTTKEIQDGKNSSDINTYRMDVVLVGANKDAQAIAEEQQEYREYYYLPQYTGAAQAYNKITYRNVYPNIDWVLYLRDGHMKYDFVVHKGGNAADIKLQYNGASSVSYIDGAVAAITPMGSVVEQKPYSYDAATQQEVPSSFVLTGNTLSFRLAATAGEHDVVIDPLLDWSTYYGGTSYDAGIDVATDASGNAYMCGSTQSSSNIATTGAYQTSFGGFEDAFLVKFNIAGVRQWATYYGGIDYDNFIDIDIDASGNIYAAGETGSSTGIATSGAHQTAFGAGFNYDIYLVKFNNSGTRQWATYYGGTGHDIWAAVTCDPTGNVYLSGQTSSSSNISSTGSYQPASAGSEDAFLAKFNSSGTRQWGTYYGGTLTDRFYGITTDASGNIYACGETQSTAGIATTGAHQTTHGGGSLDGFLVKFTSAGAITWGTYYGGSSADRINSAACDGSGNIYLSGTTASTGAIATTGSYQASLNNTGSGTSTDGFLAKLNPSGVRQWATYYGGSGVDKGYDVAVDITNAKVYTAGHTQSANRISTANAYQPLLSGTSDLYMSGFDLNGVIDYGTYLGGTGIEYENGCGLAASSSGKLYVTGGTYSSIGIASGTAHQSALSGNADGFLSSFLISSTIFINQPFIDTLFCSGATFNVPYTASGAIYAGNVFTVQLSAANGDFTTPVTIGSLASVTSGIIACTIPVATATGGGYRIRIASSSPSGFSGNNGKNIGIGNGPIIPPIATSNAPLCAGSTLNIVAASATPNVAYSWEGPNGFTSTTQNPVRTGATINMSGDYVVTTSLYACPSQKDTVTVLVKPMPATPGAGSNSPVCETQSINLTGSSITTGVTYSWTGPNTYTSTAQNPVIANSTQAMGGVYTVTTDLNGCTTTANTTVTVNPLPAAVTGSATPPTLCAGDNINLSASSSSPGATFSWTGPNSFTFSGASTTINNATTAMTGNYVATATLSGCTATSIVPVMVHPSPAKPTLGSNSPLCAGNNLTLTSSVSGLTNSWTGPNSFSSSLQNPSIPAATIAASGTYTLVVSNGNSCSASESINVTVNAYPDIPTATTNSPVCAGDDVHLFSSSTTSGVSYSWTGPNSFTSSLQNPDILNATTAAGGSYTVTTTLNGCSRTRSASVVVNPVPVITSASSNTPVCINTTLNLFSQSNTTGVAYSWTGPASFTSTQQNPAIANAAVANGGVYTVTATRFGCTSAPVSTTVVVGITTPTPVAANNGPVCVGSILDLSATNITNATYSWIGPNGFASITRNPVIANVNTIHAGVYTVFATVNGCVSAPASTTVVVNPTSFVNIYPSPNDTVCDGNVTLVSVAVNPGAFPSYKWLKNGADIPGANGSTYAATGVSTGDLFACVMSNTSDCGPTHADTSNFLRMTTMPATTPTLIIAVSPDSIVNPWPWQMVTFTATATEAGANPRYQWLRNGQNIDGATSGTWSAGNLVNDDTISVSMTSSNICSDPKTLESNKIVIRLKLGVDNADANMQMFLYPNPNKGSFTLRGHTATAKPMQIEVQNTLGQIIYKAQAMPDNMQLDEQVTLGDVPNGIYLLRLHVAGNSDTVIRFTVNK